MEGIFSRPNSAFRDLAENARLRQLFLESFSVLVVRLGQKNSEIVGKRHDLILFGRAQKIVRLLGTEGCQQSMRIEFFGCHGLTLLACAIGTTISATDDGKKEVVFLFEDSTLFGHAQTRYDACCMPPRLMSRKHSLSKGRGRKETRR